MSSSCPFCPFCCSFSPLLSPSAPPAPIKPLFHFLLFPQSLSDALPIVFLLLIPALLLTLWPFKRLKTLGEFPRKLRKAEVFSLKANETNSDDVLLVSLSAVCSNSVPQPLRELNPQPTLLQSMPMPTPMLLFTPSVGFVDLRQKVMSVPNLSGNIDQTDEHRTDHLQRSSTFGLSELEQIPSDLCLTRRRIEAGLREQRKQKAILEHVQDQLLRARLRHGQMRTARSHSPPNPTARSEREGDSHRPNSAWGAHDDATAARANGAQFGFRIGQLEQQLENLHTLASQTLWAHLHSKPKHPREWAKVQTEMVKLRRSLMEHRQATTETLADFGNELTERLALALARRMRRQLPNLLARLRDAEEWQTRCEHLEEQLTNMRSTAESLEKSESRRAMVERVQSQVWTMLGSSAISDPERLPSAVRAAIDAERHRWEAEKTLIMEKMEVKEREIREQRAEEKREASRERSQRELEWADERTQFRSEIARWHGEAQSARMTAEWRVMELTKERTRAEKTERETHARAQRAEDELAMLAESQGIGLARAEVELEAERARTSELSAQRAQLEAEFERKDTELRDCRETCAEALRECEQMEQALEETKTQNAKVKAERDKLKEELKKERDKVIQDQREREAQLLELYAHIEQAERMQVANDAEVQQRMADTDAELDTLKDRLQHTEQRLRVERTMRLADAQRSDREWEEQERAISQLEVEKETLHQRLSKAEQRVQRVEHLQQSLKHAEAEAVTERRQTEELMEERERQSRAELDRVKTELSRSSAEQVELREREAEMEERWRDAERRLDKAKELYSKLNAEMDELSEQKSIAKDSSMQTKLDNMYDQNALLRRSLEEQRGRNAKLEAELVKTEKDYDREKALRMKTEETLQRAELEGRATNERRIHEKREFDMAFERLKRFETDRKCHEEAERAQFEKQMQGTIKKWAGKMDISSKQAETTEEMVDRLLSGMWEKCKQLEKRKEEAEKERNAMIAQLYSSQKQSLVQRSELATREQQNNALQEKLAKLERNAQRERSEKMDLRHKMDQREENVKREKEQTESKMNTMNAEHNKTLAENKSISISLEELRTENLSLKQKLEQIQRERQQRLGEKCDAKMTVAAELGEETAILRAELSRERTETNRTRSELREVQQKLLQSLQKAERLQAKLDKEVTEREKEKQSMGILQKRIMELTTREESLCASLGTVRTQWRHAVQSDEGARRALRESEATCRELNAQLQRVQRVSNGQRQLIEAMESDHKRVEGTIRQTTLERNALTKSLDAMEAENAELQRHCTTLQTEVDRITQNGKIAQKQLEQQRKLIDRLETVSTNKTMDEERRVIVHEVRKCASSQHQQPAKLNRAHSHQQIFENP